MGLPNTEFYLSFYNSVTNHVPVRFPSAWEIKGYLEQQHTRHFTNKPHSAEKNSEGNIQSMDHASEALTLSFRAPRSCISCTSTSLRTTLQHLLKDSQLGKWNLRLPLRCSECAEYWGGHTG